MPLHIRMGMLSTKNPDLDPELDEEEVTPVGTELEDEDDTIVDSGEELFWDEDDPADRRKDPLRNP